MSSKAIATSAGPRYLQKAIDSLRTIGFPVSEPQARPITAIISRIADADEGRALTIARTLAQQEVFDGIVADQVSKMDFGSRFEDITKGFDSIREDAQRLVTIAEKDSLSFGDRVGNVIMKIRRGDIADRFDAIRSIYNDVIVDVQNQVERERAILEAYADYRASIKEAEILAHEIKETLEADVERERKNLEKASAAVEKAAKATPAKRAQAELARDEARRAFNAADERYQIGKDLAENLTVSYSVTEVTMAKLAQSHMAKDRIHKQAVTFFATNSSVLSALKATYTGVLGLNEATRTLDAMQEGISRSLESIADVGTKTTEAAIRKGYGPGIRADAVRKLVDSVVDFQTNSVKLIAEMRSEATRNAEEIRTHVEEGKRRVAALEARAGA